MTHSVRSPTQSLLRHVPATLVSAACVATYNHGITILSSFGERLRATKDKAVSILPVVQKCQEQVQNILSQQRDLTSVKQSAIEAGTAFISEGINRFLSGSSPQAIASAGKERLVGLASNLSEKMAGNCTAILPAVNATVVAIHNNIQSLPALDITTLQEFFLGVAESTATRATLFAACTDIICDVCFDVVSQRTNAKVGVLARECVKTLLTTGVISVSGLPIQAAITSYLGMRSIIAIGRFVFV